MTLLKKCKISIIVPCYNAAGFIKECIESIMGQSYSEWELILVNDGSQDDTAEIITAMGKQDRRLKIIHQERQGPDAARARGVLAAEGEFVTFVDSDDILTEDALVSMLLPMEQNAAVDIVVGDYEVYQAGNLAVRCNLPLPEGSITARNDYLRHLPDFTGFGCSLWGKLYRQRLLAGYHFHREFSISEDLADSWELSCKAQEIYYMPRPVYRYNMRLNSITNGQKYPSVRLQRLDTLAFCLAHDIYKPTENVRDIMAGQFLAAYASCMSYLILLDGTKYRTELETYAGRYSSFLEEYVERYLAGNFLDFYRHRFCRGIDVMADSLFTMLQQIMDFVADGGRIYIYGAGREGGRAATLLLRQGCLLSGFTVSDGQLLAAPPLAGLPILHIGDVLRTGREQFRLGIIMAMNLQTMAKLLPYVKSLPVDKVWIW